ncbi:MAG: hypothetical protein EA359_14485 [Balneolaceae bacterium]|nr:MAG: hypothetical protein EA359_14485 [Balneolaceae bacterium]
METSIIMFQKLYNFFFDDLLTSSWKSVLKLWKPMAGWTFLVFLVFSALIAPLLASFFDWAVFRGDRLFVGNEDLYTWFRSPSGFLYLFGIILITPVGLIIRYAGLYQITRGHLLGDTVSVRDTAIRVAARIPVLIKICALTVLGFIVSLIPLTMGLGIVYYFFLSEFDLNYYWIATPPEWYRALIFGGIWVLAWLFTCLIITACLLPGIPAYLEGDKSFIEALKKVWRAPISQTLKFLKIVGFAALAWFFLRIFTDAILLSVFIYITEWASNSFESLRLLSLIAGGYFFTSFLAGVVISFFGFSLISVIITKFYYSFSQPQLLPEPPGFLNLTHKTVRLFTMWTKPVWAFLLILILISGSFTASFLVVDVPESYRNIQVIAHRANALGAPENSLPALQNSVSIGADIVEIDVQLTADGTVVLLHDEDLMRVAGDPRKITEISDEELSQLRLITDGSYPDSELHIPILSEYLERAKNKIILMIELKYYGFYPELAEKTIELVRNYEMESQVLLKSMNIRAVEQVSELAPDIETGYVSAVARGDISRLPVQFLSVNQAGVTPELMKRAIDRGVNVYSWTINDREGMINAILKGVHGIITDQPELTIAIIEEISNLTATERLLLQVGLFFLETQAVFTADE